MSGFRDCVLKSMYQFSYVHNHIFIMVSSYHTRYLVKSGPKSSSKQCNRNRNNCI